MSFAVGFSIISILCIIRSFMDTFSDLISCLFRTKICVEIEYSRKKQGSRNRIALALIPAISVLIWRLGILDFEFISSWENYLQLLFINICPLVYQILRKIPEAILKPKVSKEIYSAACGFSSTIYIFLCIFLMILCSLLTMCNLSIITLKHISLYFILASYIFFLWRKAQIFASDCNIIFAILYLCALEVLPTGLLIISVVFF